MKAHVAAAAPKASDHVAKPEHHIVAKGHNSLKKASAVKAPSPKVAKSDDDKAAASDDDAKLDDHDHEKCNTPSCRAARDAKKEDDDEKDLKPDVAVVNHSAKPKLVVIHKAVKKAESKTKKPEVHTIKTRPAVHHADPSTKAH